MFESDYNLQFWSVLHFLPPVFVALCSSLRTFHVQVHKGPMSIISQLWSPAGQEGGKKRPLEEEHREWADKCVCCEITMHHKPINPARRDRKELGTVEIQKGGQRDDCKMLMENESAETLYEYRMENIKSRKQRVCQKAKVVKYRERWRAEKKNKCKPLRINSLISLWGRMKKRGFPPPILSASLWYLSSLLSHILISLASIHPIGRHSPRVPTAWTHRDNSTGH